MGRYPAHAVLVAVVTSTDLAGKKMGYVPIKILLKFMLPLTTEKAECAKTIGGLTHR